MSTHKGFIKDQMGNILLPITRGELVLDSQGYIALNSEEFLAKDGHPGLITAAERAILSNTGNGQNLTDIYTKLQYINSGLKVGNTTLNFYDSDVKATPITFSGAQIAPISISTSNNHIILGLSEITVSKDSDITRIKDITVDNYGRVTAITKGAISNAELPGTISGKTLNACITTDPTEASHIANKSYVDALISGATSIAMGALVFKGIITKDSNLTQLLVASNNNGYYKVVPNSQNPKEVLTITAAQDYQNTSRAARLGDTLIITEVDGEYKFVYIPSGNDDVVTNFSIQQGTAEGTTDILTNAVGPVGLKFVSDALSVVKSATNNTVTITLPKADKSNNGYLSKEDWVKFNSYSNSLTVAYNQNVAGTTQGAYKIGDIKIGSADAINIYGINNVSSLSIDDTITTPTLKFTETGASDVKITFSGIKGVSTIKDGNTIKIAQNSTVQTDSVSYLEILDDDTTGAKSFGVKIGTIDSNGLADTNFVINAIRSYTSSFEPIEYSLKTPAVGDPADPYRYGNDKLVAAININI